MSAHVVPVSLRQARRFVAEHHRHNLPPGGWRFGVGLANGGEELIGVAMAARPLSRVLAADEVTVEITRVCTLGERNANSMLYGAICRAAKALGYRRAVTYTLASESGASLRAAGFTEVARVRPHSWASAAGFGHGGRYDRTLWGQPLSPPEEKVRWERTL